MITAVRDRAQVRAPQSARGGHHGNHGKRLNARKPMWSMTPSPGARPPPPASPCPPRISRYRYSCVSPIPAKRPERSRRRPDGGPSAAANRADRRRAAVRAAAQHALGGNDPPAGRRCLTHVLAEEAADAADIEMRRAAVCAERPGGALYGAVLLAAAALAVHAALPVRPHYDTPPRTGRAPAAAAREGPELRAVRAVGHACPFPQRRRLRTADRHSRGSTQRQRRIAWWQFGPTGMENARGLLTGW